MSGDFDYTRDWVTPHEQTWRALLCHLTGTPARGLEIGAYEGRSALWWLDNILTHDRASLTVIDSFAGHDPAQLERYRRFLHNLARHPRASQIEFVRARSRHALPAIADASLDFAYVDGSHHAIDVLGDAAMVWHKVKPGGVILFDDYRWESPTGEPAPAIAIDAFLRATSATVLHRAWQVAVRR